MSKVYHPMIACTSAHDFLGYSVIPWYSYLMQNRSITLPDSREITYCLNIMLLSSISTQEATMKGPMFVVILCVAYSHGMSAGLKEEGELHLEISG